MAVVFGASKLPDIARNLGRSSGEFKKGLKEGNEAPGERDGAHAAVLGAVTPPPRRRRVRRPEADERRPETGL